MGLSTAAPWEMCVFFLLSHHLSVLCIQSLHNFPLSVCLYPCSVSVFTPHLSLSLYPSVTADLRPLSAGPLLVAPSWRTANRLGRGRRQCQLYWCRKGHTRQTGPVSAAAACYPPAATFTTHTYARIYIAVTQTHAHQHQRTNAK